MTRPNHSPMPQMKSRLDTTRRQPKTKTRQKKLTICLFGWIQLHSLSFRTSDTNTTPIHYSNEGNNFILIKMTHEMISTTTTFASTVKRIVNRGSTRPGLFQAQSEWISGIKKCLKLLKGDWACMQIVINHSSCPAFMTLKKQENGLSRKTLTNQAGYL